MDKKKEKTQNILVNAKNVGKYRKNSAKMR